MKKLLPILIALPVFLLSLLLLRPEATVPILVAASDLPASHTLVSADVSIRQIPKSLAPRDAFNEPSQVIGQTLRVFRGAGDIIAPSQLGGEAITLAPDERAIAIRVTDAAGLAGLLRPGDRVGVTAVMNQREGPFSKTVANSLRVLYISPEFQSDETASQVSTVSTSSPFGGSLSASLQQRRAAEGTVILAVPIQAVTIGYDFSLFGINPESRLVSLTDLLPALDLVDSVQLSLFLEPDPAEPFITSGLYLPDLVITPEPTPTTTPCPGGACPSATPVAVTPLP